MNWFISKNIKINDYYPFEKNIDNIVVKGDKAFFRPFNNVFIGIEGYVIPRIEYFDKYSQYEQYELVYFLFEKYGSDFIRYIKGVFNIIIIHNQKVLIFNDRHSIKKFFIYREKESFIISNSLSVISNNVNLVIKNENIALFCLMEHFVDGKTLFNNVSFSMPGTKIVCSEVLKIDNYWLPSELLNLENRNLSFEEIAEYWNALIGQTISYLKPKQIALTLTGGNDSRMILAALLNQEIKPNVFTYGNPRSNDVVIAKKISNKLNLPFNNYFVEKPTNNWFKLFSEKIIRNSNSLINIHRAHRLNAVENEIINNSENEMILLGNMGGEYIKNFAFADYITTKLFRLWDNQNPQKNKKNIAKLLLDQYIRVDNLSIDYIHSEIESIQSFVNKNEYNNFFHQFFFSGSFHHTQDLNLFDSKIKYVVAPFMDIDFLNLIFSTKYNILHNGNDLSTNRYKRLDQLRLHMMITHLLFPNLSDIEFGKRGYYSTDEFFENRLILFIKRALRLKFGPKYPQNFSYTGWIKDFVEIESQNFHPIINNLIMLDLYKNDIKVDKHGNTEAYWHKFTNTINLNFIIRNYMQN